MTRRPISFFVFLGVAPILLVAACSSGSTSPSVTHAAVLPVVACPTTHGVSGQHLPSKYATSIPGPATSVLTYYSDDVRDLKPVLGPRGWRCHVLEAADGGVKVTLAPPASAGMSAMSAVHVTAQTEPACQGCVYGLVCRFVPVAKSQVGQGLGPCPRRRNVKVTWVKGSARTTGATDDVLRYVVPGAGKGGVVLYRWSSHHGGRAASESCRADGTAWLLCKPILDDFQARYERTY